jgi:GNAT superfamily N-acetyltransferase
MSRLQEDVIKRLNDIRIRRAQEKDALIINDYITSWLNLDIERETMIKRAIDKKELLVAEHRGTIVGFIHYVMHTDIIDGGLNSFITAFYVVPEFRNKGVGSRLLQVAIEDSLERGVVEIEASTASPDARRLYEKHHFEQFTGKWNMGEVFLELNIPKYKDWLRVAS